MSTSDPFPLPVSTKLSDDFDREDIQEFVGKYDFREGRIREYKKAKKLEGVLENIGAGSMIITFLSFLALILVPLYSLTARFLIDTFGIPTILSGYINGTPNVESSTLLVIGVICAISFVILVVSFFVSSKFNSYARDTGLSSTSVELQKIAQSYRDFVKGEYSAAIESLEDYDGRHGAKFVKMYTESAKVNGGIDKEYVDDTFKDFFGLLIEEMHQKYDRREKMLKSIVNRHGNDYYVEQDSTPDTDEIDFNNTYLGIIRSTLGGMLSGLFSRVASFSINRPMVLHIAFLLVGVWLIQINATLAIIAITILTGGFESWRRTKMETSDAPE